MRKLFLSLAVISSCTALSAQTRYLGVGADFGIFTRGGAWADTYGNATVASARLEYARRGGLYAATRVELLFGNDVKVDPLAQLRSTGGSVYGDLGDGEITFAQVDLKSRGYRGSLLLGYALGIGDLGFGVRAAVGPSYTVHNIRIQQDAALSTPAVTGDNAAGYDRKSAGWGGSAELGLQYEDSAGLYLLYLMGSADVSRTSGVASTQFDVLAPVAAGTDTSFGLRAGIVMQLYRGEGFGEKAEDIYY